MAKMAKPKSLKATVTHLEMARRPRPVTPLPVNLHATLMKATEIPLHFYRYLQWQVGRDWHWADRLRLSDDHLLKIVHAETTQIFVLSVEGSPAGFFELAELDDSTVELSYFGLMAHVRKLGLGKWMLEQALATAWSVTPARVIVSTNTLDHPAALPLYQKVGFEPVSQNQAIIRPLADEEILALMRAET
ncbi:GNAT family N-acetyltransferase [Hoeflea sp. YIM 152468]|uniref:GNAT family N-acetyltransferase n=1 Tax=Hoeflea sp. YIM 152468 TaxID=3031759 RepID=UPI0023DC8E3D|nr:GNAT family N-acetyltransferase [Hoeflea sp. YIM 152468]MDF1609856.1 GNAT family N-acetyltransferase [Hoeflea sp. YIM 152468]